jgi:hypothetical protein
MMSLNADTSERLVLQRYRAIASPASGILDLIVLQSAVPCSCLFLLRDTTQCAKGNQPQASLHHCEFCCTPARCPCHPFTTVDEVRARRSGPREEEAEERMRYVEYSDACGTGMFSMPTTGFL